MLAMYPRHAPLPSRSFLLLGPRGTGKTTWLRSKLAKALWFDLVRDKELLRLMQNPDVFRQEVEAARRGQWIVVDEVQRLPALMGDVQDLMARHPSRWRFGLTGSSARRLRREGANLLPARVVNQRFFPLTARELGKLPLVDDLLQFGMLPAVRSAKASTSRIALLEAYVENYLAQEVRIEASIKRLDAFARFLQVAALANAQVTNVSSIARDAGVARPTVQGYFEALVDTLLGFWLPAWRPRAKIKEVAHPKFYLFDTGVARALGGRLREPLEREERGHLLETYVLHELRAFIAQASLGGELFYWRTPSGAEVDFIWVRGGKAVAIEVKAKERWDPRQAQALRSLGETVTLAKSFGVYCGARALRDGDAEILPLGQFLERLYAGRVLGK